MCVEVRGQKMTCGNQFSPSIMWVLGIELWSSDLATSALSHGTILPPLYLFYETGSPCVAPSDPKLTIFLIPSDRITGVFYQA